MGRTWSVCVKCDEEMPDSFINDEGWCEHCERVRKLRHAALRELVARDQEMGFYDEWGDGKDDEEAGGKR